MNTLVSYDIQPAVPKGWHVFVYVDGEQVIIHGAFKTWDDAHTAANKLADRVIEAATEAVERNP